MVEDATERKKVLEQFVAMIRERRLSKNIMVALGYSPEDPLETIVSGERTFVWKLVGVRKIVGFKK